MTKNEGFVQFRGYKTWYRVVGDGEADGKHPVLVLHGAHDAVLGVEGHLEVADLEQRRGGGLIH